MKKLFDTLYLLEHCSNDRDLDYEFMRTPRDWFFFLEKLSTIISFKEF
jgi:hypothetical protein